MSDQVMIEFEGERLESPWLPAAAGAPVVLIFPTVMGVSAFERDIAERLNGLGYGAMIADLFGVETRGQPRDAMFGHLQRLKADRAALRRRVIALFDAMIGKAAIDNRRSAAIGFCFGGLCALDLARSGTSLAGVAAFHGLFDPPGLPPERIAAKVAAHHGWDDPMVPPGAVVALAKELTEAGADWQIHAYGHAVHGFTNPNAKRDVGIAGVEYNEAAARRSWAGLETYLAELFE